MQITDLTDKQLWKVRNAQVKCLTAMKEFIIVLEHYGLPSGAVEEAESSFSNTVSDMTREMLARYAAQDEKNIKEQLGL